MRGELLAEQRIHARTATLREQAISHVAIVLHGEADVGMRQRDAAERFFAVAVLGGIGAQEFASRRRVEIELLHCDRGTARERGWLRGADFAAIDFDAPCVRLVARPRRQGKPRHRGDAGERFAAKSERGDRLEIDRAGDLGGGMACHREIQIVAFDAIAIVGNAYELDAAACEIDIDLAGPCVDGVLQQLLQRGRRPFDHLAGGNLVDQLIRQRTNPGHQRARPRDQWA